MDTKGTLTKLKVGKTTSYEVHKFKKAVEQYAFSLEGDDEFGFGHLIYGPDRSKDYRKRTGNEKMPQELKKPELSESDTPSAVARFKFRKESYDLQEAAKRDIKKAILGPMDADTIQMLKIDGDRREPMNFKVCELFDRMGVVFGGQKQSETAALQAGMSELVDEEIPMEVVVSRFKDKEGYMKSIGQPISSTQAIGMLTASVGGAGGKYEQAIRDFSKTPEADRTISMLGIALIQESQRLISNTAAAHGFAATAQGRGGGRGGRGNGGGRGGRAGGRGGGRGPHNPNAPILLCWSCGPQLGHDSNGCPSREQGHDVTATFASPNNARIRFCAVSDRQAYPHP
jgi:hypothetical protein